MGLKKKIRRLFNLTFGLDIVNYSPGPSEMSWWITRCDTDLVFDVGANTGQFAQSLFNMGYKGSVVSYEPMTKEFDRLLRASASNPRWTVEPYAIGDFDGEAEINISADSISSSLLKPTPELMDASPGSKSVRTEKIKVRTLSALASAHLKKAKSPFLKIDVQGFEEQVLRGAANVLPAMNGLQIELSFAPLYEHQLPFEDFLKKIKAQGFYLHTLKPFFRTKTGQDLQAEVIFFRNGYAPNR